MILDWTCLRGCLYVPTSTRHNPQNICVSRNLFFQNYFVSDVCAYNHKTYNPHTNPLQIPRFPVHVMESVSTMRARQTMANEIMEQVGTNTIFFKAEGRNMLFLAISCKFKMTCAEGGM